MFVRLCWWETVIQFQEEWAISHPLGRITQCFGLWFNVTVFDVREVEACKWMDRIINEFKWKLLFFCNQIFWTITHCYYGRVSSGWFKLSEIQFYGTSRVQKLHVTVLMCEARDFLWTPKQLQAIVKLAANFSLPFVCLQKISGLRL